jgi:ABC-type branched-subunit amino acid transport system substrate-binding protein
MPITLPAVLRQNTSSSPASKASRLALLLAALATAAACATTDPAPTAPAYSGAQRPEPTRPERPGDLTSPDSLGPVAPMRERRGYQPRHLEGSQTVAVRRLAVMLPFSSPDAEVRKIAQGLFNAAQMALFEVGADNIVLLPRDVGAEGADLSAEAEKAARDGAEAFIGPLFSQQIAPVAREARQAQAPVFSFSTDVSALGQGAYLMSLTPRTEVARIIEWAASQGVTRFAMLGPNSTYGRTVESALREAVSRHGGIVISVEYYNPGDPSPQAAARRLSAIVKAEDAAAPGRVAVLLPERGVQLRTIASLLPYFDVNVRRVRFLGTGAWNDPDVWREPSLFGGAFPAPDPEAQADFERRYAALFGEAAPRLSSFGYDAAALAATLARIGRLETGMIERTEGWGGVNGLFRLTPEGDVERALSVMQVQEQGGVRIVAPALKAFSSGS